MASRVKHVLIVDDYPDALEISVIYLQASGYHVSTSADGRTTVARTEQLPDGIVLDLELPGISGFVAARRLRNSSFTQDIPRSDGATTDRAAQVDRTAPSALLRHKSAAAGRVDQRRS